MTDLEFERYKQIQISSYRDIGAQVGEGTAMREIQIGVINRNTLVERQSRYTERWRYDAEHKAWWLTVRPAEPVGRAVTATPALPRGRRAATIASRVLRTGLP